MRQEFDPRRSTRTVETRPTSPFASEEREAILLVTFLAVDLAESSAVLASLGEGPVKASRSSYRAILRNAVSAHDGRELSHRGDQALVAFDAPSSAVACAVALQRASERFNRRGPDRLDIRIGVQIGEADELSAVSDHGDVLAGPAVEAAALCAAAQGGRILVSGPVAALAVSEETWSFEQAGLLDLEGLTDPFAMLEVRFETLPVQRLPLPAELARRPSGRSRFVGRTAEVDQLRSMWISAADGQRRLAFASGEPGIGKSRLAAEFATTVHAEGAVVLSGRSFAESIVPYQPFVEALRQFVADCDPRDLETQLGPDPAPLVRLVPELATRLALDATDEPEADERFRLFEAVAALVSAISLSSPVLLVLDDLQWADPATLLLLKHVVLDPRPASVLVLGLYRDTEVGTTHPLTSLQADLERDIPVGRVQLGGLEERDVATMLGEMIGWSPPAAVAEGLRSDTEGNPFFLQEVIAHLDESGVASDHVRISQGHLVAREIGVPPRVRDFVVRRIQRLSPGALEALGVAAIVGTEFTLDVLATVLAAEPDDIVDVLDDAVEARLLTEVSGRTGTYAFAHALIQHGLQEGHGANRRAALHTRVAEAIEALRPDDPATLSDLARHYALSTGRYAEKVVYYGSAAGDRALEQLAYEDAIEEYTRALDGLTLLTDADDIARADLLVRLGEARVRAGDKDWHQSYLSAVELCVGDGASEVLARAALGYGGPTGFGGVFHLFQRADDVLVDLLERALAARPGDDDPIRVRLLGRLASALYWTEDRERILGLSEEALDIARRLGEPATLAHALQSRHVALWGPDHLSELRRLAEEMLALAQALDDRDLQVAAYIWLLGDVLETDPIEVMEVYLRECTRLVRKLRQPYHLATVEATHAMQALLEGRFDDVVVRSQQALDLARGMSTTYGEISYQVQMTMLQLDLGGLDDEGLDGLVTAVARSPSPAWRSLLALAYATLHRDEDCAAELTHFDAESLSGIPRDCMWTDTMGMLAQAAAAVGDARLARPLYELLLPFAELNCTSGAVLVNLGPISRFLGMLATTFGELDAALGHLEHALARSHALSSPPLVARTQVDMARALLARRAEGDDARARSLLERAHETATELGMAALAEATGDLMEHTSLASGQADGPKAT